MIQMKMSRMTMNLFSKSGTNMTHNKIKLDYFWFWFFSFFMSSYVHMKTYITHGLKCEMSQKWLWIPYCRAPSSAEPISEKSVFCMFGVGIVIGLKFGRGSVGRDTRDGILYSFMVVSNYFKGIILFNFRCQLWTLSVALKLSICPGCLFWTTENYGLLLSVIQNKVK